MSYSEFKNNVMLYLKILGWKLSGRSDHSGYIDIQMRRNFTTRENEEAQEEISRALSLFQKKFLDKSVSILDVGCGDGWTMDKLRAAGYSSLTGLDLNPIKLKAAQKNGHKVCQSILPSLPFQKNQLDVIYCRDVIEHVLFANETLESFYQTLSPGGHLFLVTAKTGISFGWSEAHCQNIRSEKDVHQMLRKARFEVIHSEAHRRPKEEEYWVIARKQNENRY